MGGAEIFLEHFGKDSNWILGILSSCIPVKYQFAGGRGRVRELKVDSTMAMHGFSPGIFCGIEDLLQDYLLFCLLLCCIYLSIQQILHKHQYSLSKRIANLVAHLGTFTIWGMSKKHRGTLSCLSQIVYSLATVFQAFKSLYQPYIEMPDRDYNGKICVESLNYTTKSHVYELYKLIPSKLSKPLHFFAGYHQ